jgi:hypothetical protein
MLFEANASKQNDVSHQKLLGLKAKKIKKLIVVHVTRLCGFNRIIS